MRSSLNVRGLENYLEDLAKAGKDIDAIADEALQAGGEILLDGMLRRAPKKRGNLRAHIKMIGPAADGSYHFVKVGVYAINRETEKYFFYQENGSPRNSAHPFIRPTFAEDYKRARARMVEVFKSRGAL